MKTCIVQVTTSPCSCTKETSTRRDSDRAATIETSMLPSTTEVSRYRMLLFSSLSQEPHMWLSLHVLSIAWESLKRRIATTIQGPIRSFIGKMELAGIPIFTRIMEDLPSRRALTHSVVQVNSSNDHSANTNQWRCTPHDPHPRSVIARHSGYYRLKTDSVLSCNRWSNRTCKVPQMIQGPLKK